MPFFILFSQVLRITICIRDSGMQDVGEIELWNVKSELQSSGGKEAAKLNIQHIQVGCASLNCRESILEGLMVG